MCKDYAAKNLLAARVLIDNYQITRYLLDYYCGVSGCTNIFEMPTKFKLKFTYQNILYNVVCNFIPKNKKVFDVYIYISKLFFIYRKQYSSISNTIQGQFVYVKGPGWVQSTVNL